MVLVVASGYFDPLHVGHIEYLEKSKGLGDKLIAIVNNNKQTILKKGGFVMDELDRLKIVESLKVVDEVFLSVDEGRSVSKSLALLKPDIFTNGGDVNNIICREKETCMRLKIKMVDGLGEKIRSSSKFTK